jgi:dinuclear metal center YbgI/SA1388 family protein
MTTVETVGRFLEGLAPLGLAEGWDNVGLLVGDRTSAVRRVMTCLTITPISAAEAVQRGADLIVPHHPLPFRPLKQLTADSTVGRLLLDLIAARIAVFSLHTAFDSAADGINQRLANGLGLQEVAPLVTTEQGGAGRWGRLAQPLRLADLVERVKQLLAIERLQVVGDREREIRTLAIGCGAADEFLDAACKLACDAMLLGEARFHTCLEAEATGTALILPGHFASERFAVEHLANLIGKQFPELEVWASRDERDPIQWG